MGNSDKKKVTKNAMIKYELFADKMPSKTIKKFKRKERQDGKTEIRDALKKKTSN